MNAIKAAKLNPDVDDNQWIENALKNFFIKLAFNSMSAGSA